MAKKRQRSRVTPKAKSKDPPRTSQDEPETQARGDWISALVKQATLTGTSGALIKSKQERIERRHAKKQRRSQARQELGKVSSMSNERSEDGVDGTLHSAKRTNSKSEFYLNRLATRMQHLLEENQPEQKRLKPFHCPESTKRGKATSNTNKWSESTIQPRKRDYGGLGVARPSLYLPLQDVSFVPKLEEEFGEHVPGFFGKQRTKAMKRQLDGNMLWRKLADKRNHDATIQGKKLSDMTPDERVEAMIKAGML